MPNVTVHPHFPQGSSPRRRLPRRLRLRGLVVPVDGIVAIETDRTPDGRVVRATVTLEVTVTVRGKAARLVGRVQDEQDRRMRRELREVGYTMD